MKLLSFVANDKPGFGALIDGGIVDLDSRTAADICDLRSLLAANLLHEVSAELSGATQADYRLEDVRFLPVVPNPDKIICVGLNYEMHRKETGRPKADHPAIFVRFANSQVGHNEPVLRPGISDSLDYEGELAVVIGRRGHNIETGDAFDFVAGYSCYNDVSVREWQHHTHQFTPGKNFTKTGAFGPWLVTSDQMPDLNDQTLTTRLNGDVMQHARFSEMIFAVPEIIAYVSSFTQLEPGDVIATGTPGGVGAKRDPIVKMRAGDEVEVEISQIGTLRNTIVDQVET